MTSPLSRRLDTMGGQLAGMIEGGDFEALSPAMRCGLRDLALELLRASEDAADLEEAARTPTKRERPGAVGVAWARPALALIIGGAAPR